MKKSVIALSVAAAIVAPAAIAEVSISGWVAQEFVTDSDDTGTADDGLESHSDVGLVFEGSEDLGNGMKAFAVIERETDDAQSGVGDQIVGLEGSFGTLVMGNMEDFSEGHIASMASVDSSDALSVEPNGASDTEASTGGVAYVSPSMNGFQVGIAGYALSGGTPNDDKFDAVDMMLAYSAGGITVKVARESVNQAAAIGDKKTTSFGAEYKTGPFRVVAVRQSVDNATTTGTGAAATANLDLDGWMIGANYTMGNNKFGIGYMNDEKRDVGATTNTKNKRYILDFTHNMSKRTKIYVTYQDNDNTTTGAVDASNLAVGMKHSF